MLLPKCMVSIFLSASSHFHKSLCLSIVGQFIGWSDTQTFNCSKLPILTSTVILIYKPSCLTTLSNSVIHLFIHSLLLNRYGFPWNKNTHTHTNVHTRAQARTHTAHKISILMRVLTFIHHEWTDRWTNQQNRH